MDHAADAVTPPDPEAVQVGDASGRSGAACLSVRCGRWVLQESSHSNTGLLAGALFGAAAITAGAARIIEAINQRRPEIIKARGDARAAQITAQGRAAVQQVIAESESSAL